MSRLWRSDDTSPWPYGFGNGGDGNITISSTADQSLISATCTGSSGAYTLSATNTSFVSGQIIRIIETDSGLSELNLISSYISGSIITTLPLQNDYASAQVVVLPQYENVTINSGVTLSAPIWDGSLSGFAGFFCKGTLALNGVLSCAERGFSGASGVLPNNSTGGQGKGTDGAEGTRSTAANGNGGGGGQWLGINQRAGGGGGGNASAGSNGQNKNGATGGMGGSTKGDSELITMVMGGGGGQGARHDTNQGTGGAGGGMVFVAAATVVIDGSTGLIDADGEAGLDASGGFAGSGGGAGGSILIKTQTASIGTDRITASGGAGGIASTSGSNEAQYSGSGGAGSLGRVHIDYLSSLSGSVSSSIANFSSRQDNSLRSKKGFASAFMI